jgi:hypothetical protein
LIYPRIIAISFDQFLRDHADKGINCKAEDGWGKKIFPIEKESVVCPVLINPGEPCPACQAIIFPRDKRREVEVRGKGPYLAGII